MVDLQVLRTGPLALVEDLGRPGLANLGVGRSGAADRRAHALANRLVGNPDDAASLEITLGGFSARVVGGAVDVAVTGADARPAADGIPFGINGIHHLEEGQVLSLGIPVSGLRSYLAVRGGVDAPTVLGSRSYDTLSGIGPEPVRPGDLVAVGRPVGDFPVVDQAPIGPISGGTVDLRVVPGPREDWFDDPDALVRTDWVISERSDRVGVRLVGAPLQHRRPDRQLPSEGATRGAVQVPPNGQPVILGPDHPVTGGYPVIGVVIDADTDKVAQLRPGQPVRLHWNSRPATRADW
ncbi:MAG: biotin-dependent carboxyltransferase family protein [Mycobacterium sp.]|nr:biotin-dependent carboxyltransferase family protein [Mycobacterium sp.]